MENINVPVTTVNADTAVPFKVKYMLFTAFSGLLLGTFALSCFLIAIVIGFESRLGDGSGIFSSILMFVFIFLILSYLVYSSVSKKFVGTELSNSIKIPFVLAFLPVVIFVSFFFLKLLSFLMILAYLFTFLSLTGVALSVFERVRGRDFGIIVLCIESFILSGVFSFFCWGLTHFSLH